MIEGLYVITSRVPHLNRSHLDIARAALSGGARIIQLREKEETGDFDGQARQIRRLTSETGAVFIINDRLEAALAYEADGVHLGQDDADLLSARRELGGGKIIGISVTNTEEALVAERQGADYLGVGPIFPTPSKSDAPEPIGCNVLAEIRSKVMIPLVAIGGINVDNLEEVLKAGADSVAVISAVALAPDMERAARELVGKIERFESAE